MRHTVKKKKRGGIKLVALVALILAVALLAGMAAAEGFGDNPAGAALSRLRDSLFGGGGNSWQLTLVNADNPIAEGYAPSLAEVENGYQMDRRVVKPLRDMLEAARREGLNPAITSAYRTRDYQGQLYDNKVASLVSGGLTYESALDEAATSVARPDTSEHQLGLAVDIVAADYWVLDEAQEQTPEFIWLREHCHEYGFILRYTAEKTHITGVIYEPWHFRYVGKEAAAEIMESGLCLEEYLQA